MAYVYKTVNIPIKCTKSDLQYLFNCNRLSAQVWNLCLRLDKEHREANEGKWLTKNTLQSLTKGCVKLHAKGIQHIVHKYVFARDAIVVAKSRGRNDENYPYKQKNYFPSGWDYQSIKIDYTKGTIKLSRPKELREDGKRYSVKPVTCRAKTIPENIVQIECIWRNKLLLSIKYKEEANYLQINSRNSASIDLGEIHSITSIDNSGNAVIITGRMLRSISQLRNKHQAELYRRMSKCKKGSRQYNKYRKAMKRLSAKYENQMLDAVHKVSKHYLSYCLENDVKVAYYGDLDSATRSTRQSDKGSKTVRQKLSQWNYGQLMKLLQNKLSKFEIKLVKVKEYNTSKKCPSCKKHNKPLGRQYECSCGYKMHRDVNGAINILNDNENCNLIKYSNLRYLRIA